MQLFVEIAGILAGATFFSTLTSVDFLLQHTYMCLSLLAVRSKLCSIHLKVQMQDQYEI